MDSEHAWFLALVALAIAVSLLAYVILAPG